MRNRYLLLALLFIFLSNGGLLSQDNGWQPTPFPQMEGKVTKVDGNISYTVDSTMTLPERDEVIRKTKEYIVENLCLIHETEFRDSLYVMLFRDLHPWGGEIWGFSTPKGESAPINLVASIYGPKRNSIKHELMQLLLHHKWGEQSDPRLKWLTEGISVYANQDAFAYDGHSFEDRYVYFLQNHKLVSPDSLLTFSIREDMPYNKMAYNQCAYIAEYLLKNYDVERLKMLWTDGMDNFDKIYGLAFEDFIVKINRDLEQKYTAPIDFDWKVFNSDCFASQYDEWLPLGRLYPGYDKMFFKVDGNIKYTVDSVTSDSERSHAMMRTREYIAQNLKLLNEENLDDFIHVILVENRDEMARFVGGRIAGLTHVGSECDPENRLISVFNDNSNPLRHELMHMVSHLKWGECGLDLLWLEEGLAVFSNPEAEDCDGFTLEERYVFLLQNGKLLGESKLIICPATKVGYSQAGYTVEYLYRKYGIQKLRLLWSGGLKVFEEIYGLTFEQMISNMNDELIRKYPNPIDMDWELFNKECIK